MPPLSQSSDGQLDAPDRNIVQGPRKRRPTQHLRENGDPLACKKARKNAASTVNNPSTASSAPAASVSPAQQVLEGATATNPPAASAPVLLQRLDTADSNDSGVHTGLDALVIDVDDSNLEDSREDGKSEEEGGGTELDEDDDAELGKMSFDIYLTSLTHQILARLRKEWDAPIYVFFKPLPAIEYVDNRKAHIFQCAAIRCRARTRFVRRFLDTGDATSTSNLRRHAKACWGEEAVAAADGTRDVKTARSAIQNYKSLDGSITAAFQRLGRGTVTYSHRQFTKVEARYV